jgi:hypothetical protein
MLIYDGAALITTVKGLIVHAPIPRKKSFFSDEDKGTVILGSFQRELK